MNRLLPLLLIAAFCPPLTAQPALSPASAPWQQMWALHTAECSREVREAPVTIAGATRQWWVEHTLRAADYDAYTRVAPTEMLRPLGKNAAPSATINVTFSGFPDAPRLAFQRAVDIWETHVSSPVPINVSASWRALGEGVLGSAGASFVDAAEPYLPRGDTWYPIALSEALAGRNLTDNDPDIVASFNSSFANWYFGTDGHTPAGQYDFVTVVLHEIGHGLGFFDSFSYDDGIEADDNRDECEGVGAGFGCAGITASNGQTLPVIFDRFLLDAGGQALYDPSGRYPSPSRALGSALLAPVRFDGETLRLATGDIPVDLYAPASFDPGSSIAHLDEAAFPPGDPNSLMTPFLGRAESIFSPGPITCAIFRDLGWTLGPDCELLLGADVLEFAATATGEQATLTFRTGPQSDAVRVEVVQQYFDDPPVVVETLPITGGQTYTVTLSGLAAGRYRFQLRVVEADGTVRFGPEVVVTLRLRETFLLSSPRPNPFRQATTLTLLVRNRQDVKARLYDVTGRLVALLYSGNVTGNSRLALRVEGDGLPSGIYFARVEGEDFAETRTLVLVK